MKKDILRKLYRQKRRELLPAQKEKLDDLILIQFQLLPIAIPELVLTYAAAARLMEYDPILVEEYCLFRNPQVTFAFPQVTGEGLDVIATGPDTLFDINKFGIDEPVNGIPVNPQEIGMIFVPLLAFDEAGQRVGYGKGYYDRFLGTCNRETVKIGFSYFQAEQVIEDAGPLDIALDYCITPQSIYSFI